MFCWRIGDGLNDERLCEVSRLSEVSWLSEYALSNMLKKSTPCGDSRELSLPAFANKLCKYLPSALAAKF